MAVLHGAGWIVLCLPAPKAWYMSSQAADSARICLLPAEDVPAGVVLSYAVCVVPADAAEHELWLSANALYCHNRCMMLAVLSPCSYVGVCAVACQ